MDLNLRGKLALVTGASNGDTARSLAAACRIHPWNFMTLRP